MEVLLTVFMYLFLIGCVLFLPFLLYLCVRILRENKKRPALILAGILLCAEILMGGLLYHRPIYLCPETYAGYISEEKEADLRAGYIPARRGFWSANIPFFAVINEVTYAGEETIHVRTWYFPFGSCETGVNPDGLYSGP